MEISLGPFKLGSFCAWQINRLNWHDISFTKLVQYQLPSPCPELDSFPAFLNPATGYWAPIGLPDPQSTSCHHWNLYIRSNWSKICETMLANNPTKIETRDLPVVTIFNGANSWKNRFIVSPTCVFRLLPGVARQNWKLAKCDFLLRCWAEKAAEAGKSESNSGVTVEQCWTWNPWTNQPISRTQIAQEKLLHCWTNGWESF